MVQRGWTVGRARSNAFEATQFSRICPGKCSICHADAAFACHLRHLLSPHPYHTLRRKLEAGTPLPMSLRAFAVARAAEGRSARAGRDLQQRRLPLYVCYYYPLIFRLRAVRRFGHFALRSPSVSPGRPAPILSNARTLIRPS